MRPFSTTTKVVGYQSLARVGYVELLSSFLLVEHHKVVLVPVEDARQGSLLHLLHRHPSANTMQAQLVRRLADAEQGNPFCRCKAIAGKGLDGELFSVMLAYHRQASDAALHGVVLCIKDKHSYNNSNRSLFTFNFAFLRSLCFPCFQL